MKVFMVVLVFVAVVSIAAAQEASPRQALTKRYWVVATETKKDATGWDVDVWVNQIFVGRLKSSNSPKSIEITRFLQKPGEAVVNVMSRREQLEGKELPPPSEESFDLSIVEGTVISKKSWKASGGKQGNEEFKIIGQ
jgi:hypothetical protein